MKAHRSQLSGQISFFDMLPLPGEYVTRHGREITFDEAAHRIGQLVVFDRSTESHTWYQALEIERVVMVESGPRLICYDGGKERQLINKLYFESSNYHREHAFELAVV